MYLLGLGESKPLSQTILKAAISKAEKSLADPKFI